MHKNNIFLSIDFGTKYIGTAFAFEDTKIPNSISAFKISSLTDAIDKTVDHIKYVNIEFSGDITKIIIGHPLNYQGDDTTFSKECKKYSDILTERTGIATILIDEFLTSEDAKERVNEFRHLKNTSIHALSALIILEDYIGSL
ncbi:MAG: Holliday junction resolvase RuvX [Chlamydiia bacterium]|nr:Holliday junction resolvase RuvX [Chlamydiia bacterium]